MSTANTKTAGVSVTGSTSNGPRVAASSGRPVSSAPGANVGEYPLDAFDPSPYLPATRQARKKDVAELMAAIEANDQLQPIIASPSDTPGRYIVHSGHRRCAALQVSVSARTHAPPRPHQRRGHWRRLTHERFGQSRALWVRPAWVGVTQWTHAGQIYRVIGADGATRAA